MHKYSGIFMLLLMWSTSLLHVVTRDGWYIKNSTRASATGGAMALIASGISIIALVAKR
jgi:hypothetical protein